MQRRAFITLLGGAAVAWPLAARAQQKKIPRIGVLWHASAEDEGVIFTSLREGFKALGYVEGTNIIFEDRFPAENLEKMDLFARQFVDLKPDVLIGVSATSALALRKATSSIPIVFVFNANPVGSGLVSSLNRPGGNVTGVTHISVDLAAKRVEMLRESIPGLSSVALIWDSGNPAIQFITRPELEDTRTAAKQLGLSFESLECGSPEVVEEVLSRASRHGAAILGTNNWYFNERKRIAQLAIAVRLAVMGGSDVFPDTGLLMSYGANWPAVARAAAPLVKKILEGEKPENLPVQQPTHFELVFNSKTAEAIGLRIPPSMLARATRVIE
jgi:putative ABC transport system substrate-binding protein